MRLYIVSGIVRECEKSEGKERKRKKKKREKNRGVLFQKGRFVVLPPFLFKFLGENLSGELG